MEDPDGGQDGVQLIDGDRAIPVEEDAAEVGHQDRRLIGIVGNGGDRVAHGHRQEPATTRAANKFYRNHIA